MTSWNLSFDYSAMYLLLMLFAWYFGEKRVPLKSHRAILVVLLVALLATMLEVMATWLARNMEVVGFNSFYFVLNLQTFVINLLPVTMAYYILQIAHVDVARNKILNRIIRVAIGIDFIICFLNIWLHWAFVFENEKYRAYGIGYVLYAVDIVMIVICFYTFIRKKEEFKFLKLPVVVVMFCCAVVACVAQVFWYVPMLNLTIVIVCLTIFYYQQNVGNITDAVTGQYNRRFLGEYLRGKFIEARPFAVVMVALDDFKFVN